MCTRSVHTYITHRETEELENNSRAESDERTSAIAKNKLVIGSIQMGVSPYKFVLYTFCMRACVCRSQFQWIKHNWALLYGCYRKQTSDESQEQRKQNNKIGRKRREAHRREKKKKPLTLKTSKFNEYSWERNEEKRRRRRKKTYTHFHWIYSLARALQYISSNQSLTHMHTGTCTHTHTKRQPRE